MKKLKLKKVPSPKQVKTGGIKHDSGKPRMSLVSPVALMKLAHVMTEGERKYSSNNWREGFDWTRLSDAAHRHLTMWIAGLDNDPDSGTTNLAHAMACIMMLIEFEETGAGVDDRYKLPEELLLKLYPPKGK